MKQIVFVSGKGGTGKSTLVASLSILVKDKMLADCDVDAPNLHLLIHGETRKREEFFGAINAVIDRDKCNSCGLCLKRCRFGAISGDFSVLPMKCEGCGVCTIVCPEKAIALCKVKTGQLIVSGTKRGTFSHAMLNIGAEGSGKLVTEVKKNLRQLAQGEQWALIDGSPGIGCVVIASITGADAVVAVAEPTQSGKSDLKRVLSVAKHFGIPAYVCINKHDLNLVITNEIEQLCVDDGIPVIGKIPFDLTIIQALQKLKTPVERGNIIVTNAITRIWYRLTEEMEKATKED
jgi:MinD superfamily P-loop ATPase